MTGEFHANGKLLLSGEYLVLLGAEALAIPVNKGQKLILRDKAKKDIFHWKASYKGNTWFSADFTRDLAIINCSDSAKANYLRKYLHIILEMSPEFQQELQKHDVETRLEFDPGYGLGSSSTLLSLLGQWAKLDPLALHFKGSNGSGYDVACAGSKKALLYKLTEEEPAFSEIDFNPPFREHLFFAYLGVKQDSHRSVKEFLQEIRPEPNIIEKVSGISLDMSRSINYKDFGKLMKEHESIISSILKTQTIKEARFQDFPGEIKSLGAWGGDFIMLCTEMEENHLQDYLESKGIRDFYSYKDLAIK